MAFQMLLKMLLTSWLMDDPNPGRLVVDAPSVVVVGATPSQYALFIRAMSLSLILTRWPIVSPFNGRKGTIVSCPLIENAVAG